MKFILSLIVLLAASNFVSAQTEQTMPLDERGKFIHYEVVELKDTPVDSLKSRIVSYFKKKNSPLKFKSVVGDTTFIATGKFIINKTLLVMSHPSGEIIYQFQADLRDNKYRFWLTDFNFIPYARDRYSNFVPTTTIGVPLEANPGKLNAAQWREYHIQAATLAKEQATKFRMHMASKSPVAPPVKKAEVIRKSW